MINVLNVLDIDLSDELAYTLKMLNAAPAEYVRLFGLFLGGG